MGKKCGEIMEKHCVAKKSAVDEATLCLPGLSYTQNFLQEFLSLSSNNFSHPIRHEFYNLLIINNF